MVPVSAYLYPWDVDGDPAAADRIAGLGVTEVSLAASYHAVRAVRWPGTPPRCPPRSPRWAASTPGDLAGTLAAVRAATAERFLRRVLTAVRELAEKAAAVLAAGATDLRLYHAGLASAADHAAMREVANAT